HRPSARFSPMRVRSLLLEQIQGAAHVIRGGRAPSDEAVHRARKKIKRARASLRLLRKAVGRSAYQRENAQLRAAAQPLSRVRDTRVMLETLDRLLEQAPRRTRLATLRRELKREQLRARKEVLGSQNRIQISKQLEGARRRAGHWHFRRNNGDTLQ